MSFSRRRILPGALVLVPFLLCSAETAHGALSIALSPQVVEKLVSPGRAVSDVISLSNEGTDAADVSVELTDFTIDASGRAVEQSPTTLPSSLVPYLKISPLRITVAPGERVFFRYSVATPKAFSHLRTMIFFVARPAGKRPGPAVAVFVPRLGVPLYVESKRALPAELKVDDVNWQRNVDDPSSVTLAVTMHNEGQRAIRPGGIVAVKGASSFRFNEAAQPVLPGQTRTFSIPLNGVGGGELSISVRLTTSLRGIFSGQYEIAAASSRSLSPQ